MVTFHPQIDEYDEEEIYNPYKIGFYVSVAITLILLVGLVFYKYHKKIKHQLYADDSEKEPLQDKDP